MASTMLGRSAISEAYSGPIASVLQKYYILQPDGNIKQTRLTLDPGPPPVFEDTPGPIMSPEVIERLAALDPSPSKQLFDWIIYAAGGGERARKDSAGALEHAKTCIINNRMAGKGGDGQEITPMTQKEAEEDWKANHEAAFTIYYYHGDQDLADDPHFQCFGWHRNWPGRDGVYALIEEVVPKWLALSKDKKFLREYNKFFPAAKFQLTMYNEAGQPRFKGIEELKEYVSNAKAMIAKRRAEQNIVTVGRTPEGGYTRGGAKDILWSDQYVTVIVPLTAGASLAKGFMDWCVSNKTRWETYFRTRATDQLSWKHYTDSGPFAFISWNKVKPSDGYLEQIAAHVQYGGDPEDPAEIQYWDKENTRKISEEEIARRLDDELRPSFGQAVDEINNWFRQFQREHLEQCPALESLALAKMLAQSLIEDIQPIDVMARGRG